MEEIQTIRISVRNLVEFILREETLTIGYREVWKKMPCSREADCTGRSRKEWEADTGQRFR